MSTKRGPPIGVGVGHAGGGVGYTVVEWAVKIFTE